MYWLLPGIVTFPPANDSPKSGVIVIVFEACESVRMTVQNVPADRPVEGRVIVRFPPDALTRFTSISRDVELDRVVLSTELIHRIVKAVPVSSRIPEPATNRREPDKVADSSVDVITVAVVGIPPPPPEAAIVIVPSPLVIVTPEP